MFAHKKHTETSSTYKYGISPTESLGLPQGTKMKDLFNDLTFPTYVLP